MFDDEVDDDDFLTRRADEEDPDSWYNDPENPKNWNTGQD